MTIHRLKLIMFGLMHGMHAHQAPVGNQERTPAQHVFGFERERWVGNGVDREVGRQNRK